MNTFLKIFLMLLVMVSSIAPYANEYNDRIIAIVNDKVILKSEVQEAIDYLPPEVVKDLQLLNDKEIINKVLQSLIDTNLLLQAAERFGIKISDIALENKLVELANNQKLTINELRNQVVNSGQNYIKYVENIRNKMTIETLFVSQFYSRMNVTEEEVENFIEREKINQLGNMDYDLIELVIIDEDKTLDPSIANNIYQDIIIHGFKYVQKNYQSHKININNLGKINQEKLPDIFLKALNNKLDDQYTDLISSSKGYHVLKILDSVNKSSSIVNEYKVRHILLKPNVMSKDTEILEKLINMRNSIKNVDDFSLYAKRHSEDKISGFKGGDLGYVRTKSLVKEFADVMMKTPVEKISDPFKTRFGWHILYIENIRSIDDTKTIVRTNIANTIRAEKAKRERDEWVAKLKRQAYIEIKEF
ncbi:MAG: hypothetical protein CMD43_06575 [Gammaproteobacteria bacterium]|nr:hypothetical protein [Gammaproteobacteria bacterium]|tara:strand:+ start:1015 stop:2268 length:1254 start_codon:yes stop_codon:yes gene_type:complete